MKDNKSDESTKRIYLEGNNGGDYIEITQTKEQKDNSCCTLKVGHCCVHIISHQVPVEYIVSLFHLSTIKKLSEGMEMWDWKSDMSDYVRDVLHYFPDDYVEGKVSYVEEVDVL